MRKSIKKPLTPNAEKRLINKLKGLAADEDTQIKILQQSIDHCWQDVYELKDEGYKDIQPVYEPTKSEVTDEELQAFKERWS